MKQSDILWSQKANGSQGILRHFGSFLYEFISARLTILAFFGLFNIAAFGLHYYGYVLAGIIAMMFYYIISDAFDVFWTGIKLEYFVTKEKIVFQWGVTSKDQLEIPFDGITKLTAISDTKNRRSALIIENVNNVKNGDFALSKEQFFNKLSFENIEDLEGLITVLNGAYQGQVELQPNVDNIDWAAKLPTSTFYLKSLQLMAFVFIYFSASIGLKLIDNNLLFTDTVQDLVVEQFMITMDGKHVYNTIETKEGYKMKLKDHTKFLDEEIEFDISPIFKDVTAFHSYKSTPIRPLINSYQGLRCFFKLVVMISTLLSGWYIFYKKAEIPFMDLSVVIALPAMWAFVAFYLYG